MRYFTIFAREKMSKLKDINIPYVKSTSTMGWDELNVLKKMGPFNTYFLYLFPDCISICLNSMIIPIERRKLFQLISLNYQYKILYHVFITNHVVQALPGSRFKNMFCFDFYCFSSYILS